MSHVRAQRASRGIANRLSKREIAQHRTVDRDTNAALLFPGLTIAQSARKQAATFETLLIRVFLDFRTLIWSGTCVALFPRVMRNAQRTRWLKRTVPCMQGVRVNAVNP